jgi:hypothetical protein
MPLLPALFVETITAQSARLVLATAPYVSCLSSAITRESRPLEAVSRSVIQAGAGRSTKLSPRSVLPMIRPCASMTVAVKPGTKSVFDRSRAIQTGSNPMPTTWVAIPFRITGTRIGAVGCPSASERPRLVTAGLPSKKTRGRGALPSGHLLSLGGGWSTRGRPSRGSCFCSWSTRRQPHEAVRCEGRADLESGVPVRGGQVSSGLLPPSSASGRTLQR